MNSLAVTPTSTSKKDKIIVLFLGAFTVLILLVSAPDIGLTWDEPTYIMASEAYAQWFRELVARPSHALSSEGIESYWVRSHEHPPLSKVWSGFVWTRTRNFLDDLTAHRLGNILIASVLVMLLYRIIARSYGTLAGLVAVFALLTMPRFFFHAHLAAIDVPVATMIFAVFYTFWLGHEDAGFQWTLLLGLIWGLALATKINAFFIPPLVLAAWVLVFERRSFLFLRLALMGLIGIGIFILSWPWLYYDLLKRLVAYVGFMTIDRLPMEQVYFGELYAPPPWHYPFVITIAVVPLSILLLAIIGAISMIKHKEDRPFGGLLLLATFVPLAIFTTGLGQVFDNERLMMPAFPYLAALAGIGFVRMISLLEKVLASREVRLRRHVLAAAMSLVFVPHLLLAYDLYPHLLSYYSEVIGGAYGATRLGLETTYWCETYPEVLSYINTHAPPKAIVWAECLNVLIYYQLHGKLRPDLQVARGPNGVSTFPNVHPNPATFEEADYIIIQYRQSGLDLALRQWMSTRKPLDEFSYRWLRLAAVYAH